MRHLNTLVRIYPADDEGPARARPRLKVSAEALTPAGVCTPLSPKGQSWRTRLTVAHTSIRYEGTRETVTIH